MTYIKSKETFQQIVEITTDLFRTKGYKATSIREISRRAGINHSLIYYYCPKGKFTLAMTLIDNHRKKCMRALNGYYQTDNYLFYLTVLVRFVLRELLQDQKDTQFYVESWSQTAIERSFVIESFTAAREEGLDVDIQLVRKAIISSDSAWCGLYKAKEEGYINLTDTEIRDATDILRWTFMGLSREKIMEIINESNRILKDIPVCNIRLLNF